MDTTTPSLNHPSHLFKAFITKGTVDLELIPTYEKQILQKNNLIILLQSETNTVTSLCSRSNAFSRSVNTKNNFLFLDLVFFSEYSQNKYNINSTFPRHKFELHLGDFREPTQSSIQNFFMELESMF